MIIKKYHKIMQQPEEHRNRWALGLSITLTAFIFAGFAFYKGYLSFDFGGNKVFSKTQQASVVAADEIPSPIQNTKNSVKAAAEEISEKYREFKNSLSNVFVPFVTGIEVYERK